MADRYNDDVEGGWRDEGRRYGRQAGEGDLDRGRSDGEGRSFSPRREYERDRGDFTGPRYGAGGYTGYGEHNGGYPTGADAERQGGRSGRGGRYYGDDGRGPVDRDAYGEGRPSYGAGRYEPAFRHQGEDHSEFGFGYDLDGADGRYRQRGAQDQDRGSWGRRGREAFDLGEGAHRGRGPQGYKRSDERINEDAHERLTEDPHLDASGIIVAVAGGEVTLSGTVDSRDAKHRAEHLVEHLSGVNHVQNNLRVDAHAHLRAAGPTTNAAVPLGENTKLSEQAAGKA